MAFNFYALLYFFSCSLVSQLEQSSEFKLPLKAANLGNWLITEGWMKPSLYDGITNNALLDGTQIHLKSVTQQKYLAAEHGGGSIVVANRSSVSAWETFRLWRINENTFNLRVQNKQFLRKSSRSSKVVALSTVGENLEAFQIINQDGDQIRDIDKQYRVRIKASNGFFLQVQRAEGLVTADYKGSGWEDTNPSVFIMTISKVLQGEYQLTNAYGPVRAHEVLQEHWSTYITEADFRFLSSKGFDAVRIPVGWWIKYGDAPPKPFVGGSLQALDNAFNWAENYGLKVIIDQHALKASQNGREHSASRDGFKEWGKSNIPETVDVIDFLAQRYSNRSSLVAIELVNEPRTGEYPGDQGIPLDTLKEYYKKGYATVTKYSGNTYVILSNRLGDDVNKTELLSFASNLGDRAVIDVHYYNNFEPEFENMSVDENINYIYQRRASELKAMTTRNGRPLIFVGEWSAAWGNNKLRSPEDHRKFAKAQIDVYGNEASFGWAYWSYRAKDDYWNLKQMLESNLINLKTNIPMYYRKK